MTRWARWWSGHGQTKWHICLDWGTTLCRVPIGGTASFAEGTPDAGLWQLCRRCRKRVEGDAQGG